MEHQASLMKYFGVPEVETKKKTGEVEGKYLQTKNTRQVVMIMKVIISISRPVNKQQL